MENEQVIQNRLQSIISAAGFNPTSLMITGAITALGIAGHFVDRYFSGLERYNSGYSECEAVIEEVEGENQIEVEGVLFNYQEASDEIEDEVQEIIVDDAAQSGATVADLRDALDDWQRSQDERKRRNEEEPKSPWHSDDVPDDVSLRFSDRDKSRRKSD